jgi:SAM-dependent methyltransferase
VQSLNESLAGTGVDRSVPPWDKRRVAVQFDRPYYRRFYLDARTAVTTAAQTKAKAKMIAAVLRHLDIPVRRILDAGCGIGAMRGPLLRALPGATWLGVETSPWLCARFGWKRGTVQDLRVRGRFDLVVCDDVLQYLDDRDARRAIGNLRRVCRGALYFGALTREDWEANCDRTSTDPTPWLRPGDWYRRELARGFVPAGMGLWLHHRTPVALWDLERLP